MTHQVPFLHQLPYIRDARETYPLVPGSNVTHSPQCTYTSISTQIHVDTVYTADYALPWEFMDLRHLQKQSHGLEEAHPHIIHPYMV